MTSEIKEIRFQQNQGTQSFFDIISLTDLLTMKPADHSQFENHRLTFFVLLCITEGSGKHTVNFIEYPYEKGTIFAIGSDNIHKFHPASAKGHLLVFTEDFVIQYLSKKNASRIFQLFNDQLASPKQQLAIDSFTQVEVNINAIRQEYFKIKDDFSSEVIRSLLQIIFTQLLRIKSDEHEVFKQTKYLTQFLQFQELIEQHANQHHDVTFYADLLCITPRTLNNITHSIVAKSAKGVINDILITKVKRSLINTHQSATQIAYEIGFYEASHLFKFFKKHTGFSPKKFRESFK